VHVGLLDGGGECLGLPRLDWVRRKTKKGGAENGGAEKKKATGF